MNSIIPEDDPSWYIPRNGLECLYLFGALSGTCLSVGTLLGLFLNYFWWVFEWWYLLINYFS